MIDSTVNHPAPSHDTKRATPSLTAVAAAVLRDPQSRFNLVWPVVTFLVGYVTGLAL